MPSPSIIRHHDVSSRVPSPICPRNNRIRKVLSLFPASNKSWPITIELTMARGSRSNKARQPSVRGLGLTSLSSQRSFNPSTPGSSGWRDDGWSSRRAMAVAGRRWRSRSEAMGTARPSGPFDGVWRQSCFEPTVQRIRLKAEQIRCGPDFHGKADVGLFAEDFPSHLLCLHQPASPLQLRLYHIHTCHRRYHLATTRLPPQHCLRLCHRFPPFLLLFHRRNGTT